MAGVVAHSIHRALEIRHDQVHHDLRVQLLEDEHCHSVHHVRDGIELCVLAPYPVLRNLQRVGERCNILLACQLVVA